VAEPRTTRADLYGVTARRNDPELVSDRGEDSIHDNAVEDSAELLSTILPVAVDGVKKA